MINSYHRIILNLPDRTDRLEQIGKELPKLFTNCDTSIIHGYKSKNTQESIITSHKRCLEYGLRKGSDVFIVLEDDLVLSNSESLKSYVNEAMNNLPNDWEVLSLGTYGGISKTKNTYWNEITHFAGAHFLIYKASSVPKILAADFGRTHYDRKLSDICKCYEIAKQVAFHSDGYSDNRKKSVSDLHYLRGKNLL